MTATSGPTIVLKLSRVWDSRLGRMTARTRAAPKSCSRATIRDADRSGTLRAAGSSNVNEAPKGTTSRRRTERSHINVREATCAVLSIPTRHVGGGRIEKVRKAMAEEVRAV
jgi:hypothetical protein